MFTMFEFKKFSLKEVGTKIFYWLYAIFTLLNMLKVKMENHLLKIYYLQSFSLFQFW